MKQAIKNSLILAILCFLTLSQSGCHEYWDDGYVEIEYTYEEDHYHDYDYDYDTSGGIEVWPDFQKGEFRDYYGTYKINQTFSTCNDFGAYDPGLELPTYLEVYTYDDMMDFEDSYDDLLWNAIVYPDGTFNFATHYLDWYGHPSVEFPCDCAFDHFGDFDESFDCVCEPSNTYSDCVFTYDLI